ncbi:GH3 auxin-responsive promoter family protein [Patescibacteria group bacterium]|nr:GH3 auxin-responsive promoter family protein [Patescibacteria group bacterium]
MNPEQKVLNRIIKKCKNSKYLSNFLIKNFSLEEFRNKVPVVTYSDIEPFINRAYNGEKNIFSKDKILIWGMTSGTTGKPKLIPHTKNSLKLYKRKMNSFFLKLIWNNPTIIKGKILILTGRYCNWKSPKGLVVGSISGIMSSKIPSLFSNHVLYNPIELDKISDDKRFSNIAKKTLKENISMIASSSATYLLGFFEEIKSISKKEIKDIWPNLKIISCPCGGHYRDQIDEISKILPNVKIIDTGLGSTEGYFFVSEGGRETIGVPHRKDYLIELLDSKTKKVLTIDETDLNKTYELVISTINGILRYRIGDYVQVIKRKNKILLKFVDKKLSEISIFGERMTQIQLTDSFSTVKKKYNLEKNKFIFIAPSKDSNYNRFYLIISLTKKLDLKNIQEEIENQLQNNNINYKNIRIMTKLLKSLKINVVSEKIFNQIEKEVYKNKFLGQGRKKEVYIPENTKFYKQFLTNE